MNKLLFLITILSIVSCNQNSPKLSNNLVAEIDSIKTKKINEAVPKQQLVPCTLNTDDTWMIFEDSVIKSVGIIWKLNNHEWYQERLGQRIKYILQSKEKRFYIISDFELEKYLAQCVEIEGELVKGWDMETGGIDGKSTFNTTAINLISIKSVINDCCKDSPSLSSIRTPNENGIIDTISGYISYTPRRSPDFWDDFKIVLDSTIENSEDPSDENRIKTLIFLTKTIKLSELNRLTRDSTKIIAYGEIRDGFGYHKFICEKYKIIE